MTTIAWRLGHVIVGVLAMRNAGHFGRAETDYFQWEYAGTAAEALAQLDAEYALWITGIRGLGEEGLDAPCGEAEGEWADHPMIVLVLHITREIIHHGAEIALLRDLYAAQRP
ncbi:MAG: DinB family protein [Propionibacteriaceae bacterium]|nr:DinB family protein [Propionibacteriaceae bacterium]